MSLLIKYDAACRMLAEVKTLEEARSIRDKATAVREYARMAKNRQLEIDATEIRIRAERKYGELLIDFKSAGRLAQGRRTDLVPEGNQVQKATLEELGADKKLSSRSQALARLEPAKFEDAMADWRARVDDERARVSVDVMTTSAQLDKKARRDAREAELGARLIALPDKKYGVIYADPEWRFEPWSRATGMDRSPDNHYPTSCLEVIAARDVASIAAKDCALFLWATGPMTPHAFVVMAAWGFDYKSQYVWTKDRAATGYWNREKHELLLIGTRGDIPCPAMGTQWDSAILAPRGAHSAKPDVFAEMIEAYFPNLPKIELNRRGPPRPGWDAWGNEAS